MSTLDRLRDRAFRLIDRSATGRRVNDALGRPLASEAELADRRAFAEGYQTQTPTPSPTPSAPTSVTPEKTAAPVVIFTLDKQRRDAERLAQILEDAGVEFTLRSLENDPAAQAAVRRDSKGFRLPVVFIAGEPVGGRQELTNLGRAGIRKAVLGA
jgi:glutaredoxin